MTIDQVSWWIKQARRVEQQIEWRHNSQKYLQRVTGKKIHTNSVFLNALSWYITSYPALRIALKSLWRMIKLVARAARRLKQVSI